MQRRPHCSPHAAADAVIGAGMFVRSSRRCQPHVHKPITVCLECVVFFSRRIIELSLLCHVHAHFLHILPHSHFGLAATG